MPAGSATVAVPPLTGVPDELDELDGLLLPPQPAATMAIAATAASPAKRHFLPRLNIWAPSVMARTRSRSRPPGPLGRSGSSPRTSRAGRPDGCRPERHVVVFCMASG